MPPPLRYTHYHLPAQIPLPPAPPPLPTSSSAYTWNGVTRRLPTFLIHIATEGAISDLDEDALVAYAIACAPEYVREAWSNIRLIPTHNWLSFVAGVFAMYPPAASHLSVIQLRRLRSQTHCVILEDRGHSPASAQRGFTLVDTVINLCLQGREEPLLSHDPINDEYLQDALANLSYRVRALESLLGTRGDGPLRSLPTRRHRRTPRTLNHTIDVDALPDALPAAPASS